MCLSVPDWPKYTYTVSNLEVLVFEGKPEYLEENLS